MLQKGKHIADKPKIHPARNTSMVIGSPPRIDRPFPSFERSASLHLLRYSQANIHFLLTIFCNIHVFLNWTSPTDSEGTHAVQRHNIEAFYSHDIQFDPISQFKLSFYPVISIRLRPIFLLSSFPPNLKAPLSFQNYILPRSFTHQNSQCTI